MAKSPYQFNEKKMAKQAKFQIGSNMANSPMPVKQMRLLVPVLLDTQALREYVSMYGLCKWTVDTINTYICTLMIKLIRNTTTILLDELSEYTHAGTPTNLLPRSKKGHKLVVKIILLKWTTSRDRPVKSIEIRQGWKHKKTILLQKIEVKKG